MSLPEISEHIRCLHARSLPDGGFAPQAGAAYRPDATAWAVLALASAGSQTAVLTAARSRLATEQLNDGRISISPDHPDAFWPTPLAVLAWQGSPPHHAARTRAVTFLLTTTGIHWRNDPANPQPHDPSLLGWPWVAQTHSWVEPTSMALLALQFAGYSRHARVVEGVRMLLDRQLPHGGWNVGSTTVYGHETRPLPDCTGMALAAMAGQIPKKDIQRSIDYLKTRIINLRSPMSLAWAVLGLGAWEERPPQARTWIRESLELQTDFGPYDTTLLSLLLLAFLTDGSLAEIIPTKET